MSKLKLKFDTKVRAYCPASPTLKHGLAYCFRRIADYLDGYTSVAFQVNGNVDFSVELDAIRLLARNFHRDVDTLTSIYAAEVLVPPVADYPTSTKVKD